MCLSKPLMQQKQPRAKIRRDCPQLNKLQRR